MLCYVSWHFLSNFITHIDISCYIYQSTMSPGCVRFKSSFATYVLFVTCFVWARYFFSSGWNGKSDSNFKQEWDPLAVCFLSFAILPLHLATFHPPVFAPLGAGDFLPSLVLALRIPPRAQRDDSRLKLIWGWLHAIKPLIFFLGGDEFPFASYVDEN